MSHGIRLWDVYGNIQLFNTDKLLKLYAAGIAYINANGTTGHVVPYIPTSNWFFSVVVNFLVHDGTQYTQDFTWLCWASGDRSTIYVPSLGLGGGDAAIINIRYFGT